MLALGKRGQEVSAPADVIKDPLVLEFLDLKENRDYLERDLEPARYGRRSRAPAAAPTGGERLC